jgi:hypothetical protein
MPIRPVQFVPRPYVRDGTIGELISRRGRNAADAELRRGDIASQLWANLGNQISHAITGYQRERQEAPIRAQEAELRRIQLENAKAEQAAAQKATKDRETLTAAQSMDLDPDAIEQRLKADGRGDLAVAFRKSWMDAENAKTTLQANRAKLDEAVADYFGALASGVKAFDYDINAVRTAFAKAKADGYDDADGMLQQIEQNPNMAKAVVDSLIQRSPAQRKLVGEEQDRELKRTQEARALKTAEQQEADRLEDNRRQAAAAAEAARHNRVMESRPTGATAPVAVIGPDGKPVLVSPQDAVGKRPAAGTQKAATGLEKRALNFYNRAAQADKDLEALEPAITRMNLGQQTYMQWAPNFAQTETGQLYTQAQRAFTEARLRKDSGAAIPEQEFVNDRRTYFAQPGDSQKTLEQKRRARAAVLSSLGFESGQALGEYVGDPEEAAAIVRGYKERSERKDGADTGAVQVRTPDGQVFTFPDAGAARKFRQEAGF